MSPHRLQSVPVAELAQQRLVRVLGPDDGRRVYERTLATLGKPALDTPEDLFEFAQLLSQGAGVEAAVGAMLGVDAVLRGATDRRGG